VTGRMVVLTGCTSRPAPAEPPTSRSAPVPATTTASARLPGMPPPVDPADVYAVDRPGSVAPAAAHARSLVYVPNFGSDTLSVIDPRTYRVIRTVPAGHGPQHVVPAWDLRTLWINDNAGNTLIPIDPDTGALGRPVPVDDPYNLYFTPDGRYAMVMAETRRAIIFSDPHTMAPRHVLPVNCAGINHADFSADGRYFIATCEFSGELIKVDTAAQRVVGRLRLPGHASPDMGGVSADGRVLWLSGRYDREVYAIDTGTGHLIARIPVGTEPHGLCVWPQPGRYSLGHTGILR
jgi:YVTN family beta-propeller protein